MKIAYIENWPDSIIQLELERGRACGTKGLSKTLLRSFIFDLSDVHSKVVTEKSC